MIIDCEGVPFAQVYILGFLNLDFKWKNLQLQMDSSLKQHNAKFQEDAGGCFLKVEKGQLVLKVVLWDIASFWNTRMNVL